MTTPTAPASTATAPAAARARIGWWILVVTCALLIVNGGWLATSLTNASTFEQDTGSTLATVEAAYPGVIEAYGRQGTSLGLLVVGLGLVGAVLAWMGLRTGERSAWAGSFAVFVSVAGLAVGVMIAGGRVDVAVVWIAYAVILLIGLVRAGGRARAT